MPKGKIVSMVAFENYVIVAFEWGQLYKFVTSTELWYRLPDCPE